jgi:hypothetical protein
MNGTIHPHSRGMQRQRSKRRGYRTIKGLIMGVDKTEILIVGKTTIRRQNDNSTVSLKMVDLKTNTNQT